MAGKVDSRPGVTPAAPLARDVGDSSTPKSSAGLGGTTDTMTGAGKPIHQRWGTMIKNGLVAPFSFSNRIFWRFMGFFADIIWGKGRTPAALVDVEFKTWYGRRYMTKVSLEEAIDNQYLTQSGEAYTPEYAVKNTLCNQDYIATLGLQQVDFKWINWRGAEYTYKGTLKAAIAGNYINIFQAIKNNLITEKQAVLGKFTTVEKLTAHKKAAAEAKSVKAATATGSEKKKAAK